MIFIDKTQNPWYFYDNGKETPNNPTDIEITEEANNYYWENKGKFNIDLTKIPKNEITLDAIMQHAVDIKSQSQYEITEIDKRLIQLRDSEYLDGLMGLIAPVTYSTGREKEMLIARKKELLQMDSF